MGASVLFIEEVGFSVASTPNYSARESYNTEMIRFKLIRNPA